MTGLQSTWRTGQGAADDVEAAGNNAFAAFMSSGWLVVLLAAGLAAYLPALWGVFVFDDYRWILHNAGLDISSFDFWQRRPVTLLTFAANLYVAGPNPAAFHVVNIALHLANGVLVYALAGRMLPRTSAAPAIAALAAAIFLLHPAQTGAVSYISGRGTSLMTFWLLVGHLAAIHGLHRRSWRWTATSLAAFALAVASKETSLVYPAMWIGWLVFGKGLTLGRSLRLATPHLLVSAALLAGMLMHPGYRSLLAEAAGSGQLSTTAVGQAEQRLGLGHCFNDNKPREDSCVARRLESVAGLTRFLVAPWTISIDPGRRTVDAADALAAALAVLALWSGLRSRPGAIAAGAAWCAAALLPTCILMVRSDPVSDRLLYLPMVGIALAAAVLAGRLVTTAARPVVPACIGAALLGLALLTWQRNTQYQSELALWQDAVLKNTGNPRAHVNLGVVYEADGEFERAESEYRAALSLRPGLGWAERGLERIRLEREGEVSP
jgi:hypothetical protein